MKPDARIFGLDLLRAIAILAVLVLHSASLLPAWSSRSPNFFYFGWAGVDLFFVLSGYLVGSQALRAPEGAGRGRWLVDFWVRRWTRTIPLYLVVLFVYVGVKPLAGFPFAEQVWPFFLFLQNYGFAGDFTQSWSLCIEEQFYFVLPLLVLALPARAWPRGWWLLPLGITLAARYLAWAPNLDLTEAALRLQFPTHTHLDGLIAGLVLARAKPHWRDWSRGRRALLAGAGIVTLAATFATASATLTDVSALWVFTTLALGFALLLPLAESWRAGPAALGWIRAVALWSYGLYLWNNLVFRFAEKIPAPDSARLALAWVGTFVLAALTYRLVELPGLKLRDRFAGWRSPSTNR